MANEYPSHDDGVPTSAPSPTASLEQLRQRLRQRLQRHLNTEAFRPAITIVGFRGSDADVLRRGTDQPEDSMLGFLLPQKHSALGVLASSVVAIPPQRKHQDAALAIGVTRSGGIVSLLATADEVIDTKQPQGWLIDACLRAVGHPTPTCQVAALAFPVALWLDRLMVAIVNASSGAPVTWSAAIDLCPIPGRWRSLDPVDLGITLGSTTRSWKALRAAAVQGTRSPVGITPERAQWMDDPMFARWCMGSFPDISSLRGDVEFLAPTEVAEQVEIALRAAWLAFAD